jgi:hypothetical protein
LRTPLVFVFFCLVRFRRFVLVSPVLERSAYCWTATRTPRTVVTFSTWPLDAQSRGCKLMTLSSVVPALSFLPNNCYPRSPSQLEAAVGTGVLLQKPAIGLEAGTEGASLEGKSLPCALSVKGNAGPLRTSVSPFLDFCVSRNPDGQAGCRRNISFFKGSAADGMGRMLRVSRPQTPNFIPSPSSARQVVTTYLHLGTRILWREYALYASQTRWQPTQPILIAAGNQSSCLVSVHDRAHRPISRNHIYRYRLETYLRESPTARASQQCIQSQVQNVSGQLNFA